MQQKWHLPLSFVFVNHQLTMILWMNSFWIPQAKPRFCTQLIAMRFDIFNLFRCKCGHWNRFHSMRRRYTTSAKIINERERKIRKNTSKSFYNSNLIGFNFILYSCVFNWNKSLAKKWFPCENRFHRVLCLLIFFKKKLQTYISQLSIFFCTWDNLTECCLIEWIKI